MSNAVIQSSGRSKSLQPAALLKEEHGLGHGHASALAGLSFRAR